LFADRRGRNDRHNNDTRTSRHYIRHGDALAKLLIEKGLITQEEFLEKLSAERATYQKLLNPTPQ
jgi:hypothetical protein